MEDIIRRVERIKAALGAIADDENIIKYKAITARLQGGGKFVFQDFRQGLSDADLSNLVHSAIDVVAHLKDHLKKWAKDTGKDKAIVESAIDDCFELQVVVDLSNRDKHGEPRDGGRTGVSPSLAEINRVMQLQAPAGSSVSYTMNPDGSPRIRGGGSARVVVTATVVGRDKQPLGDIQAILEKAVSKWESVLSELGSSEKSDSEQ